MGTCLVFLLYYITPIISADDFHDIYFAVHETIREFSQKKDLDKSINCELKPVAKFNLTEIRCGLVWINEIPRRLKFWNELVPELMQWLSAEVIDCSNDSPELHYIYERRHEIYRFYKENRTEWINALQDLVYSLLNVTAEAHNHTIYEAKHNIRGHKKAYEWFQALTENGSLNWEQNWLEAYESWYTAHEYRDMFQEYPSPLKYLQTVIVNSFETVIQWLVIHMGFETETTYVTNYFPPKSSQTVTAYLPKSPRRPIILIWPSVMQPALAEAVNKHYDHGQAEEYMKITCDKQTHEWITPITFNEVRNAIHEFDETPRAPNFFGILVPELITWVSTEVIYCGFITVFPKERHQIYRFIGQNRSKWIRAVQELVYILLQVIAVIHFKTGVFEHKTLLPSSFQSIFDKSHMDWIENWDETYEIWYEKYVNHTIFAKKQQPKTQLRYLQQFVLNSLDIVTAWLFDYMGERTRNTIAAKPFSKPLWKHADFSEWTLSNDPNITCALENYDLNWFRVPTPRWDYLLDNADDKMKLMAEYFMTCQVLSGCVYDLSERYMQVIIGRKGSDWIVRTPDLDDCKHNCSDVPAAYKAYVYAYAHMTTEAGHSLHCEYNSTYIDENEVRLECYPLHVDNYLTHRQNVICKSKSCKAPCCKPLALRTPKEPQPHCEIVTYAMSYTQPGFEIQARINLPFYDIEEK